MDNLRSRVARKADQFVRSAQQAPAPAPAAPAAPAAAPPAPSPRPPAPPAAPGGPALPPTPMVPPTGPKDVAEQNVQKKIEDEKRQEQQVTKLQETVDKSTQTLESLVDAVVDLKKVVEKNVLGEPDMEDKFKELQQKKKDDKVQKKSPEEFGIDEKNLIVSKEEERMKASESLRRARKLRLAKELKYHGEGYDPKGLVYHDQEPEQKKYKQEVPAPQITKVKESEVPDLFKTIAMDLADDESTWTVLDYEKNKPLYTVPKTSVNAKDFGTREFAQSVIADMRKLGLEKAMRKHLAMPILDKMFEKKDKDEDEDESCLKEKLEEKKEKKQEEKREEKGEGMPLLKLLKKEGPGNKDKEEKHEPKEKEEKEDKHEASNFKRRFSRALRLALSAQQKNLISNPMKAAWFNILQGMNVQEPMKVIEAAFSQAALDQFEVALAKADEFLKMSDQAFIDIEASIGKLATCEPQVEVEPQVRSASASLRERAQRSSMMFTTASDSEAFDRGSALSQAIPVPKLAGISRVAKGL